MPRVHYGLCLSGTAGSPSSPPHRRQSMFRKVITCTTVAVALIGAGATRAAAQVPGNPFLRAVILTDANNSAPASGYWPPPCDGPAYSPYQACKQIDPSLSSKELGPI